MEKKKYYTTIRVVQSTDEDFNRIEAVFCGLQYGFCQGNSQPVIDYLTDWDIDIGEISTKEPSISWNDTIYPDENGVYTLLYNASVGGCFLLYREATQDEIDWCYDHNTINTEKHE